MPRTEDGQGIKVGARSRFHPGFGLGLGFDGNVFYEDRVENPVPAAFTVITGWMGIGNRPVRDGVLDRPPQRTNRKIDYNIALIGGFRQFLDRRKQVLRQSRFSLGTDIDLSILPGRRFTIDFNESFYRLAEPRNVQANANFNFNRLTNDGGLNFTLRPGGGRVSLTTGYFNQLLYFENRDNDVSRSDRVVNGVLGEVKWRFFPTSAIYARYTMGHTYYFSCCAEPGTGRNEDNFAHRVIGGYRGQVFKKMVLGAEFGWGWGFYRLDPTPQDYKGPLATLTIDVFPTLRTRIHLSGGRSFRDSLFGNYFVDHSGRLSVSHIWRWRMVTDLGVGVIGREYRGIPQPGTEDNRIDSYVGTARGGTARRDVLFSLAAAIDQPLGRFFALRLNYNLTIDSTKFATIFTDGTRNDAGFTRHLLILFGAVRY